MKKSQLKTGMIVECRSGKRALVLLNTELCFKDSIVFRDTNWTELEDFSEDMIWHPKRYGTNSKRTEHEMSVDIMKVFQPQLGTSCLNFNNNFPNPGKLLWERKPCKCMTAKQVDEMIAKLMQNITVVPC